ncbi:MAG: NAD-dependent protein deacylase [Asgard group archaeon]|nr:NAD-dependent protein deacylase [Asgard group archaeon]
MEKFSNKSLDEQTLIIAQWIVNSKHLVAFTGAGISTASGIPDFRGPDGVWTRKDKGLPPPKMKKPWTQIKPNKGHYFLVELQELGILKFLITQNTDNLHRESGILPENLAELHGNGQYVVCLNCKTKYTYEQAKWDRGTWGSGYRTSPILKDQPVCLNCSGRLISSVVNFGDPMPEDEMNSSKEHSELADVYLMIGSSLVVTPAADLPVIAMNNNAKTVLINKGETPLDEVVTIKIEEDIILVLKHIQRHIKKLLNNTKGI